MATVRNDLGKIKVNMTTRTSRNLETNLDFGNHRSQHKIGNIYTTEQHHTITITINSFLCVRLFLYVIGDTIEKYLSIAIVIKFRIEDEEAT